MSQLNSPKASKHEQNERQHEQETPDRIEFSLPATPATPTPYMMDDRNPLNFRNHHFLERKRVRTESLCSNKSSIISKDLQKIRRLDDFGKGNSKGREMVRRQSLQKKEKSTLTMKDMIYYNPKSNPMSGPKKLAQGTSEIIIKTENIKTECEKPNIAVSELPAMKVPLVPQLKLGPNGEMILDEQSLVVENIAEKEARQAIERSEIIYDDGSSGKYGVYKRQKRTREWTSDETIKFYRCLHTVGTDFSLMLQLFPNRTRRDLKIKFKKEEKSNGNLVDKALRNPKEFDIETLQKEFEKEDAEKEEKAKEEAEERKLQREEILKRKNKEINNLKKSNPQKWLSRTSRNMCAATDIYAEIDKNDMVPSSKKSEPKKSTDAHGNLESNVKIEHGGTVYSITFTPEPVCYQSQSMNIPGNTPINNFSPDSRTQEEVEEDTSVKLDMDDLDWDSLVLCTAQDPDTGDVTYGVYLKGQDGELSKDPLDLPQDVIEILKQNYEGDDGSISNF